jgi:hypothetical protein
MVLVCSSRVVVSLLDTERGPCFSLFVFTCFVVLEFLVLRMCSFQFTEHFSMVGRPSLPLACHWYGPLVSLLLLHQGTEENKAGVDICFFPFICTMHASWPFIDIFIEIDDHHIFLNCYSFQRLLDASWHVILHKVFVIFFDERQTCCCFHWS